MLKTLVIAIVLAACGGKTGVYKNDYAGSITLTLVNATPRPIESILIYPMGSPEQGSSWTAPLAPNATTTVKITSGNFALVAVSAKRTIDEHTRETPKASSMLELKSDQKLVFHDEGTSPPGVDAKGTLGVTFVLGEPDATPPSTEPTADPAPESPVPAP